MPYPTGNALQSCITKSCKNETMYGTHVKNKRTVQQNRFYHDNREVYHGRFQKDQIERMHKILVLKAQLWIVESYKMTWFS